MKTLDCIALITPVQKTEMPQKYFSAGLHYKQLPLQDFHFFRLSFDDLMQLLENGFVSRIELDASVRPLNNSSLALKYPKSAEKLAVYSYDPFAPFIGHDRDIWKSRLFELLFFEEFLAGSKEKPELISAPYNQRSKFVEELFTLFIQEM